MHGSIQDFGSIATRETGGSCYANVMKTRLFLLVLTFACLVSTPAAFSQTAAAMMSDGELAKFIDDWPATVKWFEGRSQKATASPTGDLSTALFMNKDFEAFIGKRGWKLDRFSYVAGTVFSLMSVVTLERKNPELAKQFDDSIAEVEASDLSRAEKDQNIKDLNDAKKMALSVSSDKAYNQEELKLVRARYDEIAKAAGIDTK